MRGFAIIIAKGLYSFYPQPISIAMMTGIMVFFLQLLKAVFDLLLIPNRKCISIEFGTAILEEALTTLFYAMIVFLFDDSIL